MNNKLSDTTRLQYIDIAKGILIFLVVIGHVLTGSNFVTKAMIRVINSFHMPAFFVISGLLVNEAKLRAQSFASFVKKRAIRLLVPYLVFELIGAAWQMIILGASTFDIADTMGRILSAHCYVGADWFLIALFFAEMILYWVITMTNHRWYPFVIVVSFLLMFCLPDHIWFFANCRRVFAALSFILIGIYGRKCFMADSLKIFIFSAICLIVGSAINSGTPSIGLRLFENPVLFVVCGIVGTYCTLYIAKIFDKLPGMGQLLAQCGMASLVVMGTHLNIIAVFNVVYGSWSSIWIKLIILLVVAVVEIPLVLLCRRFLPSWVGVPKRSLENR
jgi:fucose 4-O-acetylase-like acetyltransferase